MTPATERARELVAGLVGAGVRHVVLCPGSRSAPLAYAVHDLAATRQVELHVRLDERVAGFTALGIGRMTGGPAAVVTTSGTAVANLHPAVLEAHHGRIPLLVLAADRPAHLHGTWANQTSDLQAELFGAATRSTRVLGPDDAAADWADAARSSVAVARGSAHSLPGPVHLDLCFDDPLVPGPPDQVWHPRLAGSSPESSRSAEVDWAAAAGADSGPDQLTVVVAGDRAWAGARAFAERLGLPLLAEPTSGARSGPAAVGPYRLLLDEPALGGRIARAVVFGRPTLSRPVTRLLARPDVEIIQAATYPGDPGPGRPDVVRVSASDPSRWPPLSRPRGGSAGESTATRWLTSWLDAGRRAARAIDGVLDGWPVLTGPLVAREVAAATAPDEPLVLAASNAVRDVDLAARPWDWPADVGLVHANRGVSGIDGTVSTAMGMALAQRGPARALVGDVALLHDLGALVLGPQERRPDLTVVVVNDAGGGIFSLLEPGADAERDPESAARFERVFGTPHTVDLAQVCAGLGVAHRTAASAAGLREQLAQASKGLRVIEIRTDREDLRPLHDAIARAVQQAVRTGV